MVECKEKKKRILSVQLKYILWFKCYKRLKKEYVKAGDRKISEIVKESDALHGTKVQKINKKDE